MYNDGSSDHDCQQLKKGFYRNFFEYDQTNTDEFLLNRDFNSTAERLIEEANKVVVKNLEDSINMNKSFVMGPNKQILLSYKFGNTMKFFELWNKYIPDHIKTCKEYKILTLKLHVYFVILPKSMLILIQQKNHSKDKNIPTTASTKEDSSFIEIENHTIKLEKDFNKNMARLQQYLSTDGKELKYETQLRAFFALPYVEDPLSDPLFREIFNKSWTEKLSIHLQEFIAKYVQDSGENEEIMGDCIESSKISEIDITTSTIPCKIPNTDNSEKIVTKNNLPIKPNDRDVPDFLEDKSEEQLNISYERKYNMESKSTQTHSHLIKDYPQYYLVENTDHQNIYRYNPKLIQYNQELALTKSHLYNVHSNYKKLKSRFHKLHGDYHKLLSIAAELTAVLENSVKGQSVDLQGMLESCMKIFPDLFNQNIRDELQVKVQKSDDTNKRDIQPNFNIINISPKLLDFKKIKLHLINGNVKTKLLLLQALRWKITLSQPGERDEAIHEYISRDLLGLHGQIASDNGRSILPYLLTPENVPMPHPLQQSTARLLNTFASLQCGRDYLSIDSSIVRVIFNCLNDNYHDGIDSLTYDMTLSTLQKLSLRKQQRLYMIDRGLLEWLIYHLHNESNTMSFYRLKYATALLMNLSLHKQAQIRISTTASLLISTLIMLLAIDHPSVSPYVNGALNNFLANDQINNEAKHVNLSSILEQLCKNKTGEMREYLEHILKVHKRECTIDIEDDAISDNDNEEFDVLENELEENDPVKNHKAELYGEVLLSTCYMITPDVFQKESVAISKALTKTSDTKLLPLQNHKKHNQSCSNTSLSLLEHVPRESSTMTISSSMTLESTHENKKGLEKFSSIASLSNINNDNDKLFDNAANAIKFKCDKEEEAFLAKPKISRTPPCLH
ncbi:lisH domain-containing protein ARMC9-like isoform X2 [Vespa crabro]|uniref:lisH domain-containing protein ARMC9-like isoform X2 n=1 Tax=Vespa crabro TaxID=7445 RepID=UPI001F02B0CB|nr:lisH domain-containing protein ARMC9-like isoform X2 [Vespa crabro]